MQTGKELNATRLATIVVKELATLFTNLDKQLEGFDTTGVWQEPRIAKKPKRVPTAYNLFIGETIVKEKEKNTALGEHQNLLMLANSRWQEMSKKDKERYIKSKQEQLAGMVASQADPAPDEPSIDEDVVEATKERAEPQQKAQKRGREVPAEGLSEKKKKKKKGKKSEVA